jgi:hypothetical protein
MTAIFDPQDSALKRAVMVVFWLIIAAMVLLCVSLFVKSLTVLLPLAVLLVPPAWVYWHAQRIEEERPLLWALLALFVPVVGLVIYLILHPESSRRFHCPSCGGSVEKTYQICPHCGGDLSLVRWDCPHCGKTTRPEWTYCAHCGRELALAPGSDTTDRDSA